MSISIIHNRWAQQSALYRMSMSQFRLQVRHHLTMLSAFEDTSRQIASVLLLPHGRIPLSYSDHVTTTFASLREALRNFCSFLEETAQLPLVLTALSYSFLSPLLSLESQARLSADLVEELCLSYALHPNDTRLLAQRAQWASETLVEHLTQLPTAINILLDQASFQEAHLTAHHDRHN